MARRKKRYVVSDEMPSHPKVIEAGGDAGWLYVCAVAYCSRYGTDGVITQKQAVDVSDRKRVPQLITALVEQDLWHGSGHECKSCPQPLPGSYVIHDFTEELGSTKERAGVRDAKGLGGAYGNHQRWHAARDLSDPGCEFCVALGSVDRSDQGSDTDRICDPSTDRISDAGTDRISDQERSGEPDSSPKDKPPLPPLSRKRSWVQ